MTSAASVALEIVDIEAEAEYDESVFERTAVCELDDAEIALFDGTNTISDSDRDSTVDLTLRAHLVGDVGVGADEALGLYQRTDHESQWSARIVGRVVSTGRSSGNRSLRLDIGSGEMLLELDDPAVAEMDFDTGDTISADCGRVDIIGRGSTSSSLGK